MSVAELGKQTQVFLDAARQRPELANLFTSFNPQVPAGPGRAGPGEGAQPRRADQRRVRRPVGGDGRRLRERLQPVRPALSGVRAGRARVPPAARGHRSVLRAEPHHQRDGAAVHADDRDAGLRHRDHRPVQSVPIGGDHRRARAGLHVGAGDDGARGDRDPGAASRNGVRLLRLLLPGEAGAARRAHVRPGHRLRVPAPRGAVRELEAALGGAAGDAAGGAGRVPGRVGRRATTTTCSSRSA